MGKVEETIGDVTGVQSLKTSGQERRAQGETEYKGAQTEGYVQGTKDRLVGKKDQLGGAVTGDTTQETTGKFQSPIRLIVLLAGWDADDYTLSIRTRPQRDGPGPAGLEQVVDSFHPACGSRHAQCTTPFFLYQYIDGCDVLHERL